MLLGRFRKKYFIKDDSWGDYGWFCVMKRLSLVTKGYALYHDLDNSFAFKKVNNVSFHISEWHCEVYDWQNPRV